MRKNERKLKEVDRKSSPTQSVPDGFVDESILWGYRLSFIDACGADLQEIGKAACSLVRRFA